ncbi:MAG: helix-turn-helix transcriptional regulator [Chlorobi bacterium]|nr:helix-turn-helix transcriptional regulator [Chlorobiota bacterium]
MHGNLSRNIKEDPSDVKQQFANISLRLHCCRYWKLTEWECENMSFPFWRLYHNTVEGASVIFKKEIVPLVESEIVLIPPYTQFSTTLNPRREVSPDEKIEGKRIATFSEVSRLGRSNMVDHLFIHFNLGILHDSLTPGIYCFKVDENIKVILTEIKAGLISEYKDFSLKPTVNIMALILQLIAKIPEEKWTNKTLDKRVVDVVSYIDNNIKQNLCNEVLASVANMSPNSFLRLFKQYTGLSIQKYVQNRRVEKALLIMHHHNKSIDEVAYLCGFCDRHHFSKIFKKVMNISPALYRRNLTLS